MLNTSSLITRVQIVCIVTFQERQRIMIFENENKHSAQGCIDMSHKLTTTKSCNFQLFAQIIIIMTHFHREHGE